MTFARAVGVDAIVDAFGATVSDATPLDPRGVAERYLRSIDWDGDGPWPISVGTTGEWSFAREHYSQVAYFAGIGRRLSAGGEALTCAWFYDSRWSFEYATQGKQLVLCSADGTVVRADEVGALLDSAFRVAGLPTTAAESTRADCRPVEADVAFEAFALALGIDLTAEMWDGPLLTAECRFQI